METSGNDLSGQSNYEKNYQDDGRRGHNHNSNRVFAGAIVIMIGAALFAKQMGVVFPDWLFSWPMFLIVIGLYIGVRHNFRGGAWMIMMIVGSVFLIENFHLTYFDFSPSAFIWPVIIIAVGLMMILRPKNRKNDQFFSQWKANIGGSSRNENASADDYIDSVSVFGGNKKNIFSKDFKGGDIVTFFGGMELNLAQADMTSPAVIEVTQVFGGTKLIVPANWRIKSELVTVFGSFEDKRRFSTDVVETDRVLIIQGTCVFGGIDVKSY